MEYCQDTGEVLLGVLAWVMGGRSTGRYLARPSKCHAFVSTCGFSLCGSDFHATPDTPPTPH
ncbi:hypothetical protein E2C01_008002 [Portunus trituberculatus]|uniref:Uncharacterized protein n=1 Tax=Portunus trituberculatus TaxID=210409 RepID=A0A5B7CZM1_PORTR|nr:hypothetical protein [Portunus trituberculatus]